MNIQIITDSSSDLVNPQRTDVTVLPMKINFDGEEYLVNTTGAIQKKKNNVKDADDTYYCTDAKGKITYRGSEKKTD